jgi:hypothetical protein
MSDDDSSSQPNPNRSGEAMKRSNLWLGALALVSLAACGGGQKTDTTPPAGGGSGDQTAVADQGGDAAMTATAPLPEIPAEPAAEPDAVLAVISLGDPTGQLSEMGGFVDAVQPGMGAMLNAQQLVGGVASLVGAPGLEGLALDKPMYALVLDPKASGGSMLLVAGVSNEAALKASLAGSAEVIVHDGWAAIGSRGSHIASPYALSNLVKQSVPKELAATIHVKRLMTSFGPEIEGAMRQGFGPSQNPAEVKSAEAVLSVLSQIERLEGTMSANASGMTMSGWMVPVAQSHLAEFAAMQQPTDYGFAARLGAGAWPVFVASHLDLTPFKDFMVAIAEAQGGPSAQMAQVFDAFGKDFAAGVGMSDKGLPRLAVLASLADGKAVATVLDGFAKTMKGPQAWDSMTATVKAGALKVKGGSMHEVTFTPGPDASAEDKKEHAAKWGKAGMKLYMGVVGNWMTAVLDKDSKKAAKQLATAAGAAKVAPKFGKHLAAAIAESVERKESALFVIDLQMIAMAGKAEHGDAAAKAKMQELPGAAFGLGFDGGKIGAHFRLPIEQVKALAQQGM